MNLLEQYGYSDFFKSKISQISDKTLLPARIIAEHKSVYHTITENGEMSASLSGKFRHENENESLYPTVGDYVTVKTSYNSASIQSILERQSLFYRKESITGGMHILCANVDTVFICMSLNRDFNPARLERYLIMAKESGSAPVVVLTKADLSADAEIKKSICEAMAGDIPVYTVSSVDKTGFEQIEPYFASGKTVAAIGSSGVGKSTLVNTLFGQELMKTGEVREDDQRGRHTTVHRQILLLPSGGLYLDTPGLREIGIVNADEGISNVFADIENLMQNCKYSDCSHTKENGCAILAAIQNGELEADRYNKYIRFQKESLYYENKNEYLRERGKFHKQITKNFRKAKNKK